MTGQRFTEFLIIPLALNKPRPGIRQGCEYAWVIQGDKYA